MANYTDNVIGNTGRPGTAGPLAKLRRGKSVEEINTGGTPSVPKKVKGSFGSGPPATMPKATK
jgi:hypothetical protein